MDWRQQQLTIDDVRDWPHHPDNEFWDFELIEGAVIPRIPHAYAQGLLTARIAAHLAAYVKQSNAGFCTIGSGYYAADDKTTLVAPDVAFLSHARDPNSPPDDWAPVFPDLVIELLEPWDELSQARWKADVYLRRGTSLFWLVRPAERGIDVSRLDAVSRVETEALGLGDALNGEDILPGFELELSKLFAVLRD